MDLAVRGNSLCGAVWYSTLRVTMKHGVVMKQFKADSLIQFWSGVTFVKFFFFISFF